MRSARFASLLCVVIAVCAVSCRPTTREGRDTQPGDASARLVGGPLTMEDWVGRATVIFSGTNLASTTTGLVSGFAQDGSAATVTPPASLDADDPAAGPAFPMVETQVQVGTVYKDTTDSVHTGDVLTVTDLDLHGTFVIGNCPSSVPPSEPDHPVIRSSGLAGHEFLYAVQRDSPNGVWLPVYGDLGRLDLSGSEVLSTGCPPAHAYWTAAVSPAAYLADMMLVIDTE